MNILATTTSDVPALAALVDLVARERRHLAITTGFSAESTAAFLAQIQSVKGVHIVAKQAKQVVGWCDIYPYAFEGMRHVGKVGMGLAPDFRGRGIGKQLLQEGIRRAFENGLSRIELEVFSTNSAAIRLYESCGFTLEGRKVGVRYLDGISSDILIYARFKE